MYGCMDVICLENGRYMLRIGKQCIYTARLDRLVMLMV